MKKFNSYLSIYLCLLFSGVTIVKVQLPACQPIITNISALNTISLQLSFPENESLLKNKPDNIAGLPTTFYTSVTGKYHYIYITPGKIRIKPGRPGFGTIESCIHRYESDIRTCI